MEQERRFIRFGYFLVLISSSSFYSVGCDQLGGGVEIESRSGNQIRRNPILSCSCMEYWKCITRGGSPYSYCNNGGDVCCFIADNAEPVGILPKSRKTARKSSKCGLKGFDSGVTGKADMSEWPWHAAVLEHAQDLYVCGSSLVDEYWVLTAAHCVDQYRHLKKEIESGSLLKVRLGEYDVSTTAEPLKHQELDVVEIQIYPSFHNLTLHHDIALLRLSKAVKKRQNIDVVCMPKLHDFEVEKHSIGLPTTAIDDTKHHNCFVTGWGRTSEDSEHSLILKEIKVPLWTRSKCIKSLRKLFGKEYVLPKTAICAGDRNKDACEGDGGGPLVCEKGGSWYQVGIVSFGIGCGRRDVPGVYTNVAHYYKWIRTTILEYKQKVYSRQ